MHRVYSAKRGIEFRWDVRSAILATIIVSGIIIAAMHIDLILEYIIAGF